MPYYNLLNPGPVRPPSTASRAPYVPPPGGTGLGPQGPTNPSTGPGYYGAPSPSIYQPTQPGMPSGRGNPINRPAGAIMLQDSNPGLFRQRPQPILSNPQAPASGRLSEVIGGGQGMSSGMGQQQGNAGAILGSSVGAPSFYGAGLSPASGLGGGLYPSLVNLYR